MGVKVKTKEPPKRPTREEFALEDIAEQLVEAKKEEREVVLTVWGREELVRGRVTNMDERTKKIHIYRGGETVKVPFMDIMKVGSPGE